eukprot:Nitzschia sp. Nitz4//scaffold162_size51285//29119//30454//NITZ4_006970-RA/size51285-augustus-gene-0.31-mRNA-1//-1//CDS//3329537976//5090//frame0
MGEATLEVPQTSSFPEPPGVVSNDSGSVASSSHAAGVSTVATSPARSQRSAPSPTANVPLPRFQPTAIDLLDPADPFSNGYPTTRQSSGGGLHSSDDDHTEPSSSATTGNNPEAQSHEYDPTSATSTFGRFVESTRRRMNTGDRHKSKTSDDGDEEFLESALIYGYLQKLGRNGKWQTRWFETDGESLTYYKSSKRAKLLATLDLAKVGSIQINRTDDTETSFTIHISERRYHLRADSRATCKDWVITLNRVREARMQQGNVKLALPSQQPPDLLDHDYTPRVVVVANRQRTRAVDDEEMQTWEQGTSADPAKQYNFTKQSSHNALARWRKPKTSLHFLAHKLVRWAKSLRSLSCADAQNDVVLLDHHLHPPGHDDIEHNDSTDVSSKKSDTKAPVPRHVDTAPTRAVHDEIRHLS